MFIKNVIKNITQLMFTLTLETSRGHVSSLQLNTDIAISLFASPNSVGSSQLALPLSGNSPYAP